MSVDTPKPSSKNVVLYIIIAVAVLLLITAVVGWFMFLRTTNQAANLEQQLDEAVSDHTEKVSALETEIESFQNQLTEAEELNSELTIQLSDMEEDYSSLNDRFQQATSERNHFRSMYQDISSTVSCGATIDVNYASNADVSNSLREYLEREEGSVKDATWDVVWGNSRTTIHRLNTSEYLFVYIVFFEERGAEPAVFSIGQECFIDPPGD